MGPMRSEIKIEAHGNLDYILVFHVNTNVCGLLKTCWLDLMHCYAYLDEAFVGSIQVTVAMECFSVSNVG